jgi:hypothetical protein
MRAHTCAEPVVHMTALLHSNIDQRPKGCCQASGACACGVCCCVLRVAQRQTQHRHVHDVVARMALLTLLVLLGCPAVRPVGQACEQEHKCRLPNPQH